MIVWGSRLYGKVEEVPGVFHVATRFGHLWWVPLVPLSSWAVLAGSEEGDGWRGYELRSISWRSVGLAWLRIALWVAAATLFALGLSIEERPLWLRAAELLGCAAVGVAIHQSYRLTRATPDSIRALVQEKGLPPEVGQAGIGRLEQDRRKLVR